MEHNKAIGAAIVYIENNLHEPLNAVMVSHAVSYSYYHFHRHFLFVMGETIGSYIRSRRLTQAGYELVHSETKILDIALSLYFESAESFSRAFKKKYGVAPREYRKKGVDVLIASHPATAPETLPGCAACPPEIVTVRPMRVAGLSFSMSIADNPSIAMWDKLNARLAALPDVPPAVSRYGFYGAEDECRETTFHESSEATAFIGVAWGDRPVPEGMRAKAFAGGRYARFIHRGSVATLLATYRYIWGVWFPQSGYALADREDFECYTDQFLGPFDSDSAIEIYFPVQEK